MSVNYPLPWVMAEEIQSIDVTHEPVLRDLAEKVRRTNVPHLLRSEGEDMVVMMPLHAARGRSHRKDKTEADYESFRSAAGGWKDIETDKLIENIYESRRISARPPIDL